MRNRTAVAWTCPVQAAIFAAKTYSQPRPIIFGNPKNGSKSMSENISRPKHFSEDFLQDSSKSSVLICNNPEHLRNQISQNDCTDRLGVHEPEAPAMPAAGLRPPAGHGLIPWHESYRLPRQIFRLRTDETLPVGQPGEVCGRCRRGAGGSRRLFLSCYL